MVKPDFSLRTQRDLHLNRNAEKKLEAATGFEPVNNDFADRRLTTWLSGQGAKNAIITHLV